MSYWFCMYVCMYVYVCIYIYIMLSMLLFLYCALWPHVRCKRLMTALSYYIIIVSIIDASSSPSRVLGRPFSREPLACAFPYQTKTNIKTNKSNRQLTSAHPTPSSSYMHARAHLHTHTHTHTPICSKQAGTLLETPGVGDREKPEGESLRHRMRSSSGKPVQGV